MPYAAQMITSGCLVPILASSSQARRDVLPSDLFRNPWRPAIEDPSALVAQVPADVGSSPPLQPPKPVLIRS
jgi:hypothetical protein